MLRAFGTREDGTIALELALIVPILLAIFVGTFDMGFLLFQQMQVEAAADAGAAYAVAKGAAGYNATTIANVVGAAAYPTQTAITGNASWGCACLNGTSGLTSAGGTPPNCSTLPACVNGSSPGLYALVTAQVTPTPMFAWPGYPATLHSGVVVRLQ